MHTLSGTIDGNTTAIVDPPEIKEKDGTPFLTGSAMVQLNTPCLLTTSDAADERTRFDYGVRYILSKK